MKAKGVVRKSIDESDLIQLKISNDSLIRSLESLVKMDFQENFSSLSNRNIEDKLIFWRQNQKLVLAQEAKLENIFKELEKSSAMLVKELQTWKNIDQGGE